MMATRTSDLLSSLLQPTFPALERQYRSPWADPAKIAVGKIGKAKHHPTQTTSNMSGGGSSRKSGVKIGQSNSEALQILEKMGRAEAPYNSSPEQHDSPGSTLPITQRSYPKEIVRSRRLSSRYTVYTSSQSRQGADPDGHSSSFYKWTSWEDAVIIKCRLHKMTWTEIGEKLPGRSAADCRQHYESHLRLVRSGDFTWNKTRSRARLKGLYKYYPATDRSLEKMFKTWHPLVHGLEGFCNFQCTHPDCGNISPYKKHILLSTEIDVIGHSLEHGKLGYTCPFCVPRQRYRSPRAEKFLSHVSTHHSAVKEQLCLEGIRCLGLLAHLALTPDHEPAVSETTKNLVPMDRVGLIDSFHEKKEKWLLSKLPTFEELVGDIGVEIERTQRSRVIVQCPKRDCLSNTWGRNHQKCRKCVDRSAQKDGLPDCHKCGRLMEYLRVSESPVQSRSSYSSVNRSVGSSASSHGR